MIVDIDAVVSMMESDLREVPLFIQNSPEPQERRLCSKKIVGKYCTSELKLNKEKKEIRP